MRAERRTKIHKGESTGEKAPSNTKLLEQIIIRYNCLINHLRKLVRMKKSAGLNTLNYNLFA